MPGRLNNDAQHVKAQHTSPLPCQLAPIDPGLFGWATTAYKIEDDDIYEQCVLGLHQPRPAIALPRPAQRIHTPLLPCPRSTSSRCIRCGLDALMYTLVLRAGMRCFFAACLCGLPLLLPVNAYGAR